MSDLPEPDRIEGAPHPRETVRLIGQDAVEARFLEAYGAGRLHHGWLITGQGGVGKATLAWRIARFLLASSPADTAVDGLFGDALPAAPSLDIAPDHPVARRILAGSEPGLHLLRRGGRGNTEAERAKAVQEGNFSKEIRVDDVRELGRFLNLSAVDGGRRVVIVDSVDEMTTAAANALLKMLEEPPARTTLLLVSHQPGRLLPTIRSRCRDLRLGPLNAPDMAEALAQAGFAPGLDAAALAELSAGSVGEAIRLITLDGLSLYAEIIAVLDALPRLDHARALKLADSLTGRGAEVRLALFLHLSDIAMSRLARTGATGQAPPVEAAPRESEILMRLAPSSAMGRAWASAAQEIGARMRHGTAVNLDPAALVLDMVFRMKQTA
jgi:DNA polymerase-3 subunit delta'